MNSESFFDAMVAIGMGLSSFCLFMSLKELNKKDRQCRILSKTELMDIKRFNRIKKIPGNVYALRLHHDLFKPFNKQIDYYSNHKLYKFPNQIDLLNQKSLEIEFLGQNQRWLGKDILDYSEKVQLHGLGRVLPQALNVKMTAIQIPEKLTWKKMAWKWVASLLEGVLSFLCIPLYFGVKTQQIKIKGVKIGYFDVDYDWVNSHLLASVEINEQRIPEVQVLGKTLSSLVQASKHQRMAFLIVSTVSFAIAFYCANYIYKKIKKMRKQQIMNQKDKQRKALEKQQIEFQFVPENDEQMCAICMVNNKNIIFVSCLHLVQCHQCYVDSGQSTCPICKTKTKIQKIYSTQCL